MPRTRPDPLTQRYRALKLMVLDLVGPGRYFTLAHEDWAVRLHQEVTARPPVIQMGTWGRPLIQISHQGHITLPGYAWREQDRAVVTTLTGLWWNTPSPHYGRCLAWQSRDEQLLVPESALVGHVWKLVPHERYEWQLTPVDKTVTAHTDLRARLKKRADRNQGIRYVRKPRPARSEHTWIGGVPISSGSAAEHLAALMPDVSARWTTTEALGGQHG